MFSPQISSPSSSATSEKTESKQEAEQPITISFLRHPEAVTFTLANVPQIFSAVKQHLKDLNGSFYSCLTSYSMDFQNN